MLLGLGYLIAIGCVFGAYVGMGGHLGALYQPLELVLIGGAAFGAFIAGNNKRSLTLMARDLPKVFRRLPYDKALYMDVMACLYTLLNKAKREGLMKLEGDIENPEQSPIFQKYPQVLRDQKVMDFVVDYLRLMVSGNMSAIEIEALMDEELETFRHETNVPVKTLRAVGDAMPAFGIVAAVLGVIKALAAVDQEAFVLADLISKAMVGTFLGILCAYAIVFPLADTMERRASEAVKALECVKVTLLAYLNGYPPQVAVEFGRKVLYSIVRPSFVELETQVRATKSGSNG
ncbi:flagellar motor stator protein MotA [Bordetella sp. 02P26C-1]|uniref:flagellar motor stator protein MotA n=1 Tax=unclassified Bordetella TaxID=2630031 RepID=UPI00132475CA|nr:flagellar motor stator protein MotA [Bordetella sp. 15P40C-2]MVW78240.1 flagellar motor stator protein MotA [Bordetella sp. 02P26C-1]